MGDKIVLSLSVLIFVLCTSISFEKNISWDSLNGVSDSGVVSVIYDSDRAFSAKLKPNAFFGTLVVEKDKDMPDITSPVLVKDNSDGFFSSLVSFWMGFLLNVLLIFVFGFLLYYLAKSSGLVGGKSTEMAELPDTRLSDVAGMSDSKDEVIEIIEFLKDPDKFKGAKMPKGILMSGPPGNGKTLLAKAIAGEAGVPFFYRSGSSFMEMYVGVGASRVRSLFKAAAKHDKAIIFIDEIDAVGSKRSGSGDGGSREAFQTLDQLLTEMDGMEDNSSIIVIAATNRIDTLDPALIRPGRFDRRVVVSLPNMEERRDILKVHVKDEFRFRDIDLDKLAAATIGFSGADLANIVNESSILAARRGSERVSDADVHDALDVILMGHEKKNRTPIMEEMEVTAAHEMGHAIINLLEEDYDDLMKVTIVPRGMALGATISVPGHDKSLYKKSYFESKLRMLLGGRAAEMVVFGDVTSGASNDIERATYIARDMVVKYGMSSMGLLNYEREFMPVISEKTANKIDKCIREIVDRSWFEVVGCLAHNKDFLMSTSFDLLENGTIDGKDIIDMSDKLKMLPMAEFYDKGRDFLNSGDSFISEWRNINPAQVGSILLSS